MDYLLALCTELRLFVLAAPGPYICSETQAGGHPTWLVAKKHVRIRHSRATFDKPFDIEYSKYCREWLHEILPIIAAHQITYPTVASNAKQPHPHGCVIALQIENENFETFKGIPVGSADDMRYLARVARECGITVPLFHNDGFEEGSWVSHEVPQTEAGVPTFGLDLYAFDKYVVFCPTSTPQSLYVDPGAKGHVHAWKDWEPATVVHAMDSMERKVREFGGCAATGPLFIAELQGGWFNHYMLGCSYDTIYDYYGEDYTRLVYESSLAQGVSILNLYMAYGGTNWGTLGDPDVYTSYDYSACIREFMYLSGRGRKLRQALAFSRSFGGCGEVAVTQPIQKRDSLFIAKPDGVLNMDRRKLVKGGGATVEGGVLFYRNFSNSVEYTLTLCERPGVVLNGSLALKRSFVGLYGYTVSGDGEWLELVAATLPVIVKTRVLVDEREIEVWVVQNEVGFASGELAFDGPELEILEQGGPLSPHIQVIRDETSVVSFGGSQGWCSLGRQGKVELLILALNEQDLFTLVPTFEDPHWFDAGVDDVYEAAASRDPVSLAWGVYGVQHDIKAKRMDIEWLHDEESCYCLFSASAQVHGTFGFEPLSKKTDAKFPYFGLPGLLVKRRHAKTASTLTRLENLTTATSKAPSIGTFHSWKSRTTDYETLPWVPLTLTGADNTVPSLDTVDLGYTSGHVLYKLVLPKRHPKKTPSDFKIRLNIRHRAILHLNGTHILGGHTTYGHRLLKPGSKQGPDPFRDTHEYTVPAALLNMDGDNIVYVIIESFGLSRQAFVLNDVRSPRGIVNVELFSVGQSIVPWRQTRVLDFGLFIAGVDVKELDQPFNVCGFPDEFSVDGWTAVKPDGVAGGEVVLRMDAGYMPKWFEGVMKMEDAFVASMAEGGMMPVRFHMNGPATAHIWVDGIYLARYYGNGDCVQRDFYVPDTFCWKSGSLDVKMLVYDGREGADWVSMDVRGWSICKDWSGNVLDDEAGQVFFSAVEKLG
ncbi:glycoside hydrolase superfamily [Chytriomyces cf. hyalinus JEL632]|nr:glycoside hydrolase superfamily [Chytriomyces cf. hyalinus JEL632]